MCSIVQKPLLQLQGASLTTSLFGTKQKETGTARQNHPYCLGFWGSVSWDALECSDSIFLQPLLPVSASESCFPEKELTFIVCISGEDVVDFIVLKSSTYCWTETMRNLNSKTHYIGPVTNTILWQSHNFGSIGKRMCMCINLWYHADLWLLVSFHWLLHLGPWRYKSSLGFTTSSFFFFLLPNQFTVPPSSILSLPNSSREQFICSCHSQTSSNLAATPVSL